MNENQIQGFYNRSNFKVAAPRSLAGMHELQAIMGNPDLDAYLSRCLPERPEVIGKGMLLDYVDLIDCNHHYAPFCYLYEHGFLTIITTWGFNGICVDSKTGKVYFVMEYSFDETSMRYFDSADVMKWKYDYSYHDLFKALIPLANDLGILFDGLDREYMMEILHDMDCGRYKR